MAADELKCVPKRQRLHSFPIAIFYASLILHLRKSAIHSIRTGRINLRNWFEWIWIVRFNFPATAVVKVTSDEAGSRFLKRGGGWVEDAWKRIKIPFWGFYFLPIFFFFFPINLHGWQFTFVILNFNFFLLCNFPGNLSFTMAVTNAWKKTVTIGT